jgi:hypothetical protein
MNQQWFSSKASMLGGISPVSPSDNRQQGGIIPTAPVNEEEKAEAEVEAEPRSEEEDVNLGKASLKDVK